MDEMVYRYFSHRTSNNTTEHLNPLTYDGAIPIQVPLTCVLCLIRPTLQLSLTETIGNSRNIVLAIYEHSAQITEIVRWRSSSTEEIRLGLPIHCPRWRKSQGFLQILSYCHSAQDIQKNERAVCVIVASEIPEKLVVAILWCVWCNIICKLRCFWMGRNRVDDKQNDNDLSAVFHMFSIGSSYWQRQLSWQRKNASKITYEIVLESTKWVWTAILRPLVLRI